MTSEFITESVLSLSLVVVGIIRGVVVVVVDRCGEHNSYAPTKV